MELRELDLPGPKRDYVGYGGKPPKVVWPDGAMLALNLVVNYEAGAEYSHPAGDRRNEGLGELNSGMASHYRDFGVESTFEYESRAGVWRLLRLFEEYDVRVTFFACAVALERNPAVGEWIERVGHEPCSHGWRWSKPWLFPTREIEREHIASAVSSIRRTCGQRPEGWFWRTTPTPSTRELLVEEGGFVYDSDAVNDDLPYFVDVRGRQHLVVPYTFVYNDVMIAQGKGGLSDFSECCRRGIDELWREGASGYPKMMSISLHPRWMGQAARAHVVREIIEYARNKGEIWFARRIDIARWWLAHHEEFERERRGRDEST